ncbi:hypothetical protein GCM10017559_36600 [Streptosporangium longisporum]|uniref:Secreted protein n=1 Tax=Streptosporangium longisporum TaxID=46187 RepID=A0ABP6KHK6_9ACTN
MEPFTALTATWVSVPPWAATTIGVSVATPVAPFRGATVTRAAAAGEEAGADPPGVAVLVEQEAVTRARASSPAPAPRLEPRIACPT